MCTINAIIKLLKIQGKTQKQLCDVLGIGKQTFSNWKSGISHSYTKYLSQIAVFLNVSVDSLLNFSNELKEEKTLVEETTSAISDEEVVYHRDGKPMVLKLNSEQKKMFDFWVNSQED